MLSHAVHTPVVETDPRDEIARLRRELADARENERRLRQLVRAQGVASIGAVSGGAAEDLKRVLTPMLMSIALLDEQLEAPASRRLLNVISDSAQRGAGMLRQMQAFARGADHREHILEPRQLLEDLRRLMAEIFPQSIDLVVEAVPEMPAIKVDPTKLLQALVHLCVNARDAMPGGGRLLLRAEVIEVDKDYAEIAAGARLGRYVVINVSDTGRGMSVETRTRVFRPYIARPASQPNDNGLQGVQTTVRGHGGFMTVHSEPERGTTIQVFIPAVDAGDPHLQTASLPIVPCGSNELILVIDTEAFVRVAVKQVLTSHGYRVITAANGADAIAEFARQSHEIALVLSDTTAPVMDGVGALRALRLIDPSVKLIAAVGNEKVDAEGIATFVRKPYRADALLQVIRHTLDR